MPRAPPRPRTMPALTSRTKVRTPPYPRVGTSWAGLWHERQPTKGASSVTPIVGVRAAPCKTPRSRAYIFTPRPSFCGAGPARARGAASCFAIFFPHSVCLLRSCPTGRAAMSGPGFITSATTVRALDLEAVPDHPPTVRDVWGPQFPKADLVKFAASQFAPLPPWAGEEGPRFRIVVSPGALAVESRDWRKLSAPGNARNPHAEPRLR